MKPVLSQNNDVYTFQKQKMGDIREKEVTNTLSLAGKRQNRIVELSTFLVDILLIATKDL
jgi:hypothetical protein